MLKSVQLTHDEARDAQLLVKIQLVWQFNAVNLIYVMSETPTHTGRGVREDGSQ
jgi:hypothetical protein